MTKKDLTKIVYLGEGEQGGELGTDVFPSEDGKDESRFKEYLASYKQPVAELDCGSNLIEHENGSECVLGTDYFL